MGIIFPRMLYDALKAVKGLNSCEVKELSVRKCTKLSSCKNKCFTVKFIVRVHTAIQNSAAVITSVVVWSLGFQWTNTCNCAAVKASVLLWSLWLVCAQTYKTWWAVITSVVIWSCHHKHKIQQLKVLVLIKWVLGRSVVGGKRKSECKVANSR